MAEPEPDEPHPAPDQNLDPGRDQEQDQNQDAKRLRRRRILVIGAAVLAILLACCCSATAVSALTWGRHVFDRNPSRVHRDEPGRDGKLEFTVKQVECGVGQIGNPYVNQTAIGQFCMVGLLIRNVGKSPATFIDSLQRAYGPDGARFAADSGAGILANSEQQIFLNEINPGNQVTGLVVYDIPTDTRITEMRLHESEHSRGVTVLLE